MIRTWMVHQFWSFVIFQVFVVYVRGLDRWRKRAFVTCLRHVPRIRPGLATRAGNPRGSGYLIWPKTSYIQTSERSKSWPENIPTFERVNYLSAVRNVSLNTVFSRIKTRASIYQVHKIYTSPNQGRVQFKARRRSPRPFFKARRLFNRDAIFARPPFDAGFYTRQAFIQDDAVFIFHREFSRSKDRQVL